MIKMVTAELVSPCAARKLTIEHLGAPPSEHIQLPVPSLSLVENSKTNGSSDRYTPAVTDALDEDETYRHLNKRDISLAPLAGGCIAQGSYLADLERTLSWVDWSKLERWQEQPLALLQALTYRDQQTIPAAFWHSLDPRALVDEGSFDKAAFVYARLKREQISAPTASSDSSALDNLRRMFRSALQQQVDKQQRLEQLAAPPENPDSTAVFYDGLAWRNAAGKSFNELVQALDWQRVPGGNALNSEQKHALLQEKFTQWGESSQYSIGTPEQSLASTVQRILSYQRQPVPARFDSEQQLTEHFVALERDWESTRDYPIHPRLVFALHLVRASGVDLRPTRWRETFWQQHLLPRLVDRVKAGDIASLTWLVERLGLQGDPAWLRKLSTPDPSALPALLDALADTTRAVSTLSAQTLVSETFAELLRQQRTQESLRELAGGLIEHGLGKEIVEGDDSAAYARAALQYAGERLLAVGGEAPKFERRRMAETILRRYGLTEYELSAPRHYTLASANPNFAQSKFGSRVDEFLARADWAGVAGKTMVIAHHTVNPQDELQRAEEAFNRDLLTHPWVRAKAKENLRAARVILTQRALSEEIQRLLSQYQAETETQRAWKRGIETWLNTVPVLGPIYNIEEGIRHQFPLQAILGVISLGLDAFDLVSSGGGGSHPSARRRAAASLPSRDRNVLATVDTLRETMRLPPLEIDARVVINHDVLGINTLDTDLSTAQRALAQHARAGHAEVSWQGNTVVYLRNEGRVALVKERAGRYEEIDWLTGLPRESQHTIFREGTSSGYYSAPSHRTQADPRLSLAQTEIRGDKIVDRFTVQTVTALLEGKHDLSLRAFEDIFARHFTLSPGVADAQRFDCRAFYQRLYSRSPTFRRVVNGFDTSSDRARPWSIMIDDKAARAGSTYRAFTNFELRRIVVPSDEGISRMTYMSVDGVKVIQAEQVYLHEMLHALTGARDPVRQLDLLNRGPIVYLTDKILSEAGYRIPPQVMYRREDRLPDLPAHETVAGQREAAAHAMVIEDLYLDRMVDGITMPTIPNDLSTAATSQSLTLRQRAAVTQALANYRSTTRPPAIVSVTQRLCKQFGLNEQDSLSAHTHALQAVHFYRRLYEKSTTFRHLFDNYTLHAHPEAHWHYVWHDNQRATSGIERDNQTIYLLNDDGYYLSDEGVLPIERERKLAYYMLEILLLPHMATERSAQQATLERGAAVYFTDKILHEAGYHFPQQLSAQTATSRENAHYTLLRYHSAARRIVASEQAYLT